MKAFPLVVLVASAFGAPPAQGPATPPQQSPAKNPAKPAKPVNPPPAQGPANPSTAGPTSRQGDTPAPKNQSKKAPLSLKTTNPKGFRPFIPVDGASHPPPKAPAAPVTTNKRKRSDDLISTQPVQDILFIGSILVPILMANPVGFAISAFLSGTMFFGPQIAGSHGPAILTPDQIFAEIFGKIEAQIDASIDQKFKSVMISQINGLGEEINRSLNQYFSRFGITTDTQGTMDSVRTGKTEPPIVTADEVSFDIAAIDTALRDNQVWYLPVPAGATVPKKPDDMISPFFILANPQKIGAPSWCLHTEKFNTVDGTELLLDNQCDYSAVFDKMFFIDEKNGNRLLLANKGHFMCVAYKSKDGTDIKQPLAIYGIDSAQCKSKSVIRMKQDPKDKSWILNDGKTDICAVDGSKQNIGDFGLPPSRLATPEKYTVKDNPVAFCDDGMCTMDTETKGQHPCLNNGQLKFQTMVPIILNSPGSGGATGATFEPPLQLDEIGVQLYYFPKFARIHLMALKEMFLFGNDITVSPSQFGFLQRVADYKDWLDVYSKVFEAYSIVRSMKTAPDTIKVANEFRKELDQANLEIPSLNDEFINPPSKI